MLEPKRTKFRRYHRGKMKGKANKGNTIIMDSYLSR